MSHTSVPPLPKEAERFLMKIIEFYRLGSRDGHFAEWAATHATLLLEHYGLLH